MDVLRDKTEGTLGFYCLNKSICCDLKPGLASQSPRCDGRAWGALTPQVYFLSHEQMMLAQLGLTRITLPGCNDPTVVDFVNETGWNLAAGVVHDASWVLLSILTHGQGFPVRFTPHRPC